MEREESDGVRNPNSVIYMEARKQAFWMSFDLDIFRGGPYRLPALVNRLTEALDLEQPP